jgi:SAM-dependent methyltransferase
MTQAPTTMQRFQELAHPAGHNYRTGSPHLTHLHLYERLVATLRQAMGDTVARGLPATMLEIGAGHGGFTEPALAYGWRVTATEMSRPSIDHMRERYDANPSFRAVFDEDGSLTALGGERFALILCASVLHHIPDYLQAIRSAVERHLLPGGAFVGLQDPLWYPSLSRTTHTASDIAYLSWRLTQGNYLRGIKSRLRWLRGAYDDANPSDLVEYHVVRSGVDHRRIQVELARRFDSAAILPYWSTQSRAWQRAGEALHLKNTFAALALGYRPGAMSSER